MAPNPGTDTITFDSALNGGTIDLSEGELSVVGDISIQGPGANQLAVDANSDSRVMRRFERYSRD